MRVLPVAEPGTPAIGSPWRYLGWLVRQQKARVALGILWGCTWMVAQAIVPAVIGAAVDALIGRRTHAFAVDCAIVLGLGVITAVSGILRHRCVVEQLPGCRVPHDPAGHRAGLPARRDDGAPGQHRRDREHRGR